jgi:type I restriction-modification system DNA methylase subunit
MDKTRIIHFVQKAGGHFYTEMLASKPAQKREGVSFTIEQLLEFAEMIAKYKREPLTDEQIEKIYRAVDGNEFPIDFCREIEFAHGIKGE